MSALIDVSALRAMFEISEDVEAPRLTYAITAGNARVKDWVTDQDYNDATGNDEQYNEKRNILEFAVGVAAMHYAIRGLNSNITPKGMVLQAKEEGSVVIQYLTPQQTAQAAQDYLEQAEELCRPYRRYDELSNIEVISA